MRSHKRKRMLALIFNVFCILTPNLEFEMTICVIAHATMMHDNT